MYASTATGRTLDPRLTDLRYCFTDVSCDSASPCEHRCIMGLTQEAVRCDWPCTHTTNLCTRRSAFSCVQTSTNPSQTSEPHRLSQPRPPCPITFTRSRALRLLSLTDSLTLVRTAILGISKTYKLVFSWLGASTGVVNFHSKHSPPA